MIIKDHVNIPGMAGFNPLIGPNDSRYWYIMYVGLHCIMCSLYRFGPRFPPLSTAYDKDLRQLAIETAHELGMSHYIQVQLSAYIIIVCVVSLLSI